MKAPYSAEVNGQYVFEHEQLTQVVDMHPMSPDLLHVLDGSSGYQVKILDIDRTAKTVRLEIEGRPYSVTIKDHFDQLIERMGLNSLAGNLNNEVKAPMPGLVLSVNVKVGQEVSDGEGLLILEAMKMENIIKASGAGIVKSIHVDKGKAVDKGQLLVELE